MKHDRLCQAVFVAVAALALAVIGPRACAVTFQFDQLDWLNGTGGYTSQNSDWGRVAIGFSLSDAGSFTPFGSGYLGFVNVVTTVPSGGNNNWAVENLPVVFDSLAAFNSELPFSVRFNLGTQPGFVDVGSLSFVFSIDSTPRAIAPSGTFSFTTVGTAGALFGGEDAPPVGGSTAQAAPPAAQNFVGVAAGNVISNRGRIAGSETNVPAINEENSGCAPGAAARSIKYLGSMFPTASTTQTAQQVYGALTNLMNSSTGPNGTGTVPTNFVAGKNLFFTTNNLPIMPTVVTNSFPAAISALNSTSDVEMGVFWGYSDAAQTSGLGGHCVFVTEIIEKRSNNTVTGYVVNYIDDMTQGDGMSNNTKHVVMFDAAGNLMGYGVGAQLNSFRIEAVPEPSTLGLAALGVVTLVWVRCRRRH